MTQKTDISVLDAASDLIATADLLTLCVGEPTDRTDATTELGSGGKMVGQVALAGGDVTTQPGDTAGGSKAAVAAKTGIPITVDGTPDHIAVINATTLLHVTVDQTPQAVTNGGTAQTSAFDIEFEQPTIA